MTAPLLVEEVHEEVAAMDSATIAHLRRRAQKELYFTAKGLMGYQDVNLETHGKFCAFIQRAEQTRRLALMPRGHLKSSIATEADSVRLALNEPDETRILLVNEILANAQSFLLTVKSQFEKNQLLKALFPELILSRFTGPGIIWNTEQATLPRSTSYKEPTWMAIGVGGAATSKHFTHIKGDDLIGLEARRSPAELHKAISWNRNIESLAINAHRTTIDWIGTRWGRNDLYGDIIQRYDKRLAYYSRGAVENGKIIFPEFYTWEFYNTIINETPDIWAAQYMNDPTSELSQDFAESNVRSYRVDNEGAVVFKENNTENKWYRENLDRIITVDPNSGSKTAPDEAAITVAGMAPDENVFVLESFGGRPTPTELTDTLFRLCQKWRPRLVGIEKAGQQTTRFYWDEKMKKEQVYFMTVDLKHRNQDKNDRIRTALEPVIASQRLHLLPSQTELRSQIANFPDLKNDDRIDSLAYQVELWRKPMGIEQQEKNREAVKLMLMRRSAVTGY